MCFIYICDDSGFVFCDFFIKPKKLLWSYKISRVDYEGAIKSMSHSQVMMIYGHLLLLFSKEEIWRRISTAPWSMMNLMRCIPFTGQSCSFPGSPAHGLVTFSDENLGNGAVASYTCERGFELLGPARRVCDQGNWTPEGIPFCGEFVFRDLTIFAFVYLIIGGWNIKETPAP